MKLDPETPLGQVPWIPRNRVAPLERLGLTTLSGLVRHFPRRHEDRAHFAAFPTDDTPDPVLLCGRVVKASFLPYGKWRRGYEAVIEDEPNALAGNRVVCRWFNMSYLSKSVTTGLRMVVFGRAKRKGKRVVMDFPEFEMLSDDGAGLVHLDRLVPVHPAGEGISPRKLREWIFRALDETDLARIAPLFPGATGGSERAAAIRAVHFPESTDQFEKARATLAREEFFAMQMVIASRRNAIEIQAGREKRSATRLLKQLHASLPFDLTPAQRRAVAAVKQDLESPRRMNRLLQGDVGSGKTIVAVSATVLAAEAGFQTLVMTPTQLLAEQHCANFRAMLEPMGIHVVLRTSANRRGAGDGGRLTGEIPDVIIGTHALLFEPEGLGEPGLVIVDEQHKFGVMQRAALSDRAEAPDVLVMTATPIPRTLAQTVYGDLDVTVIDQLPPGRGKVVTGVRPAAKLAEAAEFIRRQIEEGRQIYIVYPLVNESDKLIAKAANAEFERWNSLLFPHSCALLHGKMRPDEKADAMRSFVDGDAKVLVSTTVIEVGIDVPNATVMLIENAERFGLAQLHQLRGRIGRGGHRSYCILITGSDSRETLERLAILERTTDGFEVAEADLRIRGPGDLLGTAQTGLPPLRLGNLHRDAGLIDEARAHARAIFAADPELRDPSNAAVREWLGRRTAELRALAG